jgi:hypothetical protein
VGLAPPHHRATAAEPFHPDSPFRTPVPAAARIDPASPAVTAHLTGEGRVYASLVEFGIPDYTADAGTPRYRCRACGPPGPLRLRRRGHPDPRRRAAAHSPNSHCIRTGTGLFAKNPGARTSTTLAMRKTPPLPLPSILRGSIFSYTEVTNFDRKAR